MTEQEQVKHGEREFETLINRIAPRFARIEALHKARAYVKGLLSSVERKNGWQMAELAGESNPYGFQHLMGRAVWSADEARNDLRDYVQEHLQAADGVGVFDETGFLKKGTKSVGVQRQYSGTAGKVENCQIGVFLTYASSKGQAFLDRELYLPESWTSDPRRCAAAGVPEDIKFETKPELALKMLKQATQAGITFPWVTGDSVYGNNPTLRSEWEKTRQPYVLAVASTETVNIEGESVAVASVAKQLPHSDWERHSAGNGSKGPRTYDWATIRLEEETPQGWEKWLLLRRSLKDPQEIASYRVLAPEPKKGVIKRPTTARSNSLREFKRQRGLYCP
ncbi:MAG: IS701 family transposase [Microcystaceae cyanobacterium]